MCEAFQHFDKVSYHNGENQVLVIQKLHIFPCKFDSHVSTFSHMLHEFSMLNFSRSEGKLWVTKFKERS